MTAILVIVSTGLLAAVGVLRNQLQELRIDLERHKIDERLQQVINRRPANVAGMELVRPSWKEAA